MGGGHGHGFDSLDLRILAVFVVMACAMLGTVVAPVVLKLASKGTGDPNNNKSADIVLKKVLRVLTALSIGIILGTALLHLLPEASEMLTEEWGGGHAAHGDDAHGSSSAAAGGATAPVAPASNTSAIATTSAPHDDHDHDHTTTAAPHDDDHDHTTTAHARRQAGATTTAAPHDDHDDHDHTTTASHHDDHDDHDHDHDHTTTAAPHDDHDDHDHGSSGATGSGAGHDDHGHGAEEEEGHDHPFPYAFVIALAAGLVLFAIERELHAIVGRRRQEAKQAREAREADKKAASKNAPLGASSSSGEEDLKAVGAEEGADAVKKQPSDAFAVPVDQDGKTAEEQEEEALERAREQAMTSHIVDIGLSIHSVILGLAIGLLTGYGNVRVLFIAAAFDQFADGVAVGATLSESRLLSTAHTTVLRIIFGLSCAIGIAIGIGIEQADGTANKATQGVLMAISGGMLLVIALTNMMPVLTKPFMAQAECCVHENHDAAHSADHDTSFNDATTNNEQGTHDETHAPLSTLWRLGLYFCVALGIAAMAVIAIWG